MLPSVLSVSRDPAYGYTRKKPVEVGPMDQMSGEAAALEYLKLLRTKDGRPFAFRCTGKAGVGGDGHVVLHYLLSSRPGEAIGIYIDIDHPLFEPCYQAAPVGLTKAWEGHYEADLAASPPPATRWWQFWK